MPALLPSPIHLLLAAIVAAPFMAAASTVSLAAAPALAQAPQHPVMEGVPAEFKISDEHYRVILDDAHADHLVELVAERAVP